MNDLLAQVGWGCQLSVLLCDPTGPAHPSHDHSPCGGHVITSPFPSGPGSP